jgi:hypothetical protein
MADKNLSYDAPAYLAPHVMAGGTLVGANGVAKFAAFTAMQIKAVNLTPHIASTAAGSQPLMYTISGTATATSTLTVLTSAAKTTVHTALATRIALARGDVVVVTHGTDATASLGVAIECDLVPGASIVA